MIVRKTFFLLIFSLLAFHSLRAASLAEQFQEAGYVEICNQKPAAATFDSLYGHIFVTQSFFL